MTRTCAAILGVAVACAGTLVSAGQKSTGSAVIRGKVTSEAGEPLAGTLVRVAIPAADMRFVHGGPDHRVVEARANASGVYELTIPDVTASTRVSLDAMKPGFRRLVGTQMRGGDVTDFNVAPGSEHRANLVLKPALYIKGTVVDEDGHPIKGVLVDGNANSLQASGGVERTATNDAGVFEIFSYPVDRPVFEVPTRGAVGFTHPDFISHEVPDVYALGPFEQQTIWVVLKRGHRLAGVVRDSEGRPVAGVMVRAIAPLDDDNRKATLTDAQGKFTMQGLTPGARMLTVIAKQIEQKAELALNVTRDETELTIALKKFEIGTPSKSYEVLGMTLTDLTAELQSAYGLHGDEGALILNPGSNSNRLKIGKLEKGYTFWMVGEQDVSNVKEFVQQVIAEADRQSKERSTASRVLNAVVESATGEPQERFSIRVVYSLSTVEFDGTNTQYLDLGLEDIESLKKVQKAMETTGKQ